jgi:hypothetical protein
LCPPHLAWRSAARFPEAPNPIDDRADAHAKLRRRLAPRYATFLNRRNHPFTKIQGIGSAHRVLASAPASTLNQNPADLGIPNRFRLNSSRSSFPSSFFCHHLSIDIIALLRSLEDIKVLPLMTASHESALANYC